MKKNVIAIRPEGLIEARYNLTSKENDIIDMILNIIKDDDKYVYEIDLEKYKKLFKDGFTNIYRDMKKATRELYNNHNKFTLKDRSTGKEFYFVWFSMLNYNDKEGSIYFEIGETLKKLLLEVKKRIYYDLKYTLNFRSIYSKRMYYMLKSFEDTGWRLDNIDDLKYKLNCPRSYKNYALFEKKVLLQAQKEINNSDISFTYKLIKTGRKVTSIRFTITSNKARNEIAAASDIKEQQQSIDDINNIKQVQSIFNKHTITELEASYVLKDANNNLELIKQCYNYLLSKSVKNVVGYMRTLVKEFKEPQGNIKTDNFNNYEQRTYNFDELEQKLLGLDK